MLSRLALVTALALVLALSACSRHHSGEQAVAARTEGQGDPSAALKELLDRLTTDILKEWPGLATSLAVPETIAGGKYSHRLGDISADGNARRLKQMIARRAELRKIDRARLSPTDQVSYDVVATSLEHAIAGQTFGFGSSFAVFPSTPYVVTQIDGAYAFVPDFLDTQHQVKTVQDAEDYLSRLKEYARGLDQETARISADAAKDVIPPDFVIDGAIGQLQTFASTSPADTVLVRALKRKVAEAKLDATQQKELTDRAEDAVKDLVLPAYRRQIEQLRALRTRATHDAGVWKLPRGAEFYAVALAANNTTNLTPDEIHEMGLRLIEQLHEQMDAILDAQGFTTGTVAERVQKLWRDPQQLFPNTDAGREQLLRMLNQQVAELRPLLPKYFGQLARAKLEIRRVPPYIEAGAPGGYYQSAALDGSRPGAYYINLRDTRELPKFTLPTLTYHEGNPGHHWQGTIAQESTGLPLIRGAIVGFPGYWEGWALYAEQLVDEMGLYGKDPLGRLGYLQSMAFRAARLVVDTGLHHKRWTREQAIDYMAEATGDRRSTITTEVERYSVWPGQATAYMVGRETINRLRADAQSQLGERFDLRAFHDVVLKNGAVPLSVLESIVDSWVAEQAGAGR